MIIALEFVILFPNRLINKCPAIMFAVNRTASDPGRIRFLIVSIITINGIRGAGVPLGIKCANISWDLFIHPNIINLNHIGNAKVRVNTICLLLVKIYGNNPIMLLYKININNLMIINLIPLDFIPNNILNSLYKILHSFWLILDSRLGNSQYIDGKIINPINVLDQFSDIFMLVAGSKVENKFAIIFNLYF